MHTPTARRRLLAAGALLILGVGLAAPAGAETPDFDAALARAKETGQPLVLDFMTDW